MRKHASLSFVYVQPPWLSFFPSLVLHIAALKQYSSDQLHRTIHHRCLSDTTAARSFSEVSISNLPGKAGYGCRSSKQKKVHIENFSRKEIKPHRTRQRRGGGISSVFPTSLYPLSKSGRRHFRWRIKFFLLLPHVERHFSDLIPFSLKRVSVFELQEERKTATGLI